MAINEMVNRIKNKFITYNTNQWDGDKGIEVGYLPIAKPLTTGEAIFFLFLRAGTYLPLFWHQQCDTTISIIEGKGEVLIKTPLDWVDVAKESREKKGKYNKCKIPKKTPYGFKVETDTYLLISQTNGGMFKELASAGVDFRFYREPRKRKSLHN